MPAPPAAVMQNFAKTAFVASAVKLPMDWKEPSGDSGTLYAKAFKPGELTAVPPPALPALFFAASTNEYHCDTVRKISRKFEKFINGICSAICSAWSQWQSLTSLTGVMINAVTASGGTVVGPPLFPLIMASAPKKTPGELKYSNAIAMAIDTAWLTYTATIKVPGLPWYPAFAAFPAPVAPPMPNVPTPFLTLTQVPASLSRGALKGQMIANLADPMAPHHKELFDAIAASFDQCFQIWRSTTMVTNVLGTGPVPSFAPPFVPVGPVVGGVGNMIPGGFV